MASPEQGSQTRVGWETQFIHCTPPNYTFLSFSCLISLSKIIFLCIYFIYVYDAPKHWTDDFTRCAYLRPDHPNQVLIQYSGELAMTRKPSNFRSGIPPTVLGILRERNLA